LTLSQEALKQLASSVVPGDNT